MTQKDNCSCAHHPFYGVEVDIDCPLHGESENATKGEAHTVAELLAMPDPALNALAAELRGIRRAAGSGGWIEDSTEDFYDEIFLPATERNQSGELLEWATDETGICFDIFIQPGGGWVWIVWTEANKENTEIPGNDAHAETAAFCAAMLTLEGRLNG